MDLLEKGDSASIGKSFGAVEIVKASSDVNFPIPRELVKLIRSLLGSPGKTNSGLYVEGWMIKVNLSNPPVLESFIGLKEYKKL